MKRISVLQLIVVIITAVGIGSAQWIAQPLLSLPAQNLFPTVTDVNRDGKLDIVGSANPGGVWFWAGDTAHLPNWTPLDTIEMNGVYTYSTGVGDFNRDGRADLVCTSWPGVYTWTGDGAANPQWTPQARPDMSGFYIGCQAKDLNHDTVTDIVASTSGGSGKGINVWLSDGNANPNWIRQPAPGPDTTRDYHSVTVAEVNKDGHLDIIAGHQNASLGIKVWTGNGGQGGQVIFTPQESPTTSGVYLTVAVGDVNNDNNPDIVGAQQGAGIGVWTGDGNTSPHWTAANPPPASGDFWGVNLGDLNRDGNLDIIASNVSSREVQAWFGNGGQGGSMQWTAAPQFTPSAGYEGIVIADVNYDNKPDVIAGNWTVNGVQVWINDLVAVEERTTMPLTATIIACAPNPFCRKTTVTFSLVRTTFCQITVYDATGRLVTNGVRGEFGPGAHQFSWDGRDENRTRVSAGVYFVALEFEGTRLARQVVLLPR